METAAFSTRVHELESRRVMRDGVFVGALRILDHGGTFAVVAELVGAAVRPYMFTRREDAKAFLAEVVASMTYLGCEVLPG